MTRQTDQMMRDILRRADLLSRDQRSTNARLLDPRNQNKMKTRSAGVVHTNWTALWWKRPKSSAQELQKGMRAKRHNAGTEMINRMERVRKKMAGKKRIMKERDKLHVVQGMCFEEFACRHRKVALRTNASIFQNWTPHFCVCFPPFAARWKKQNWPQE